MALDLYPPTSREAPTHVPQTVMAKDRNSSKRMGLKCIGASQPGKLGMSMIAVICGTLHLLAHLSHLAKTAVGEHQWDRQRDEARLKPDHFMID